MCSNVNKQFINCNKHVQTFLVFIDVTNISRTDNVRIQAAVFLVYIQSKQMSKTCEAIYENITLLQESDPHSAIALIGANLLRHLQFTNSTSQKVSRHTTRVRVVSKMFCCCCVTWQLLRWIHELMFVNGHRFAIFFSLSQYEPEEKVGDGRMGMGIWEFLGRKSEKER